MSHLPPPPGEELPQAPEFTTEELEAHGRGTRNPWKSAAIGLGTLATVLAVALIVVLVTTAKTDVDDAADPESDATTSLPLDQTLEIILCPGGACIDSSEGVITVNGSSTTTFSDSDLQRAGRQTELWSNADVERMLRTRALDGTQSTSDGSVTWTYHPDNGLDIVIEVPE